MSQDWKEIRVKCRACGEGRMAPTHVAGTDVYVYECPVCDQPWFSRGDPPDESVRVVPALRIPPPDLSRPVLLAYVDDPEAWPSAERAFYWLVAALDAQRRWTTSPPEFVDCWDGSSCTRPSDQPIRTLGAALLLSPPGAPHRTPRADIDAFLGGLSRLCGTHEFPIFVELHGEIIADVSITGEISMNEARLDPWP